MKKICFLFILLPFLVFSQTDKLVEEEGIVITQRDTVKVFFRLPVNENNTLKYADLQYSVRVFKSAADTASAILLASQALQIEFNYNGERVKMASTNNYLDFKKGFLRPDLLFLKIEKQGKATLCSYYDPSRNLSSTNYSPKHYYVLYQRGKTFAKVGATEAHLGITTFFKDCERLKNLAEYQVTFENFTSWVDEYNKGKCKERLEP